MSEVRYVTVPCKLTVVITNPDNGLQFTVERGIEQFVSERTKDPTVFGRDLDAIMLGLAIRQAFTGCEPGQVVGLPLPQWEALCAATRKPHGGYNAEVMYQVVPHAQAILDAPSTRPESDLH